MSILYSCVGFTDPMRDGYEGGILHIIRHYNPTDVYLVLSKETEEREHNNNFYTYCIKKSHPECKIHLIKTGIEDVHKIDSLHPIIDEFNCIMEKHPNEEILLNLSSGTPQMKMIMSFLAVECGCAKGIQVDSPQKKANVDNHVENGTTSPEILMENNMDDLEGAENRCSEPELRLVRKNFLKKEINALLNSYEYEQAYYLYTKNKGSLNVEVGKLLKHANLRLKGEYNKAVQEVKGLNVTAIESQLQPNIRKLHEYIMLMEVWKKRKFLQEFYIKVTPLLYELLKYHFEYNLQIPFSFLDKKGRIDNQRLQKQRPDLYSSLVAKYSNFRDQQYPSFIILLIMLKSISPNNDPLVKDLEILRKVEEKIRHMLAHKIEIFTEENVLERIGKSTPELFELIYSVFKRIMKKHNITEGLIYDSINDLIKEKLIDI